MDILEVVPIFHRIYQVFSLTQLDLKRKPLALAHSFLLEFYSSCVLLISTSFLFYSLSTDKSVDEIGETVNSIQLIGVRVAHIFSILESIARRKEEKKFYEKVQEIDHIFERTLSVGVDNRSFRSKTLKRAVLMGTVYVSCALFVLGIMFNLVRFQFFFHWLLYTLPFVICCLRYFQIFTSIAIIKHRLDILVGLMKQVNLTQTAATEVLDRMNHRSDMEQLELQKLLIMRDIYDRLWQIKCIVNRSVGVSVLINMANDFLSFAGTCYWIVIRYSHNFSYYSDYLLIAGIAVRSIPHLCNVMVMAIICDQTMQCTNKMALILHKIEIDNTNSDHNTVIEQFSKQLLHQRITFSAAGFYIIDRTLLFSIIGTTTAYLLILLQFHINVVKAEI